MKMVRSLLLGSAAGLVAVTAGQAADLPVKAKPVAYVKICSLYGAGFYYMPGTDMCLKIGGWVRAEASDETNGSLAWGPFNGNSNTRATNNLAVRSRGYITADAREQTAYGVARAYIDVGINSNITDGGSPAGSGVVFSSNRAYVQWAGFTVGLAQSFFDFYPASALNYRAGYIPQQDTGDGGWWVWGYTAQLGGGISVTLSAEERRNTQIFQDIDDAPAGVAAGGFTANNGYGGWQVPDIVGNFRVDQAWGSFQVMGAAHQLNPLYYGKDETSGHPSDDWGFVVGAGIKLNTPFITPGDYFAAEVNYTQGALKYLNNGEATNRNNVYGGTEGYGIQADCVYGGLTVGEETAVAGTTTGCEKTTGWGVDAGFEHHWTPQWKQSFAGGYMNVNYDAAANNMLCAFVGDGAGIGATAVAAPGCNNNWSYWSAGTRLQWDVSKSFYLGVEVLYSQLISAKSSTGFVFPGNALGDPTLCDTGTCKVSDESNWAFTLRMHKDFLP